MKLIKKIWKTGTGHVVTIDKKFMRFFKLKAGDEIITTQLPHAVSGLKVEVHNTAISQNNSEQQSSSELP